MSEILYAPSTRSERTTNVDTENRIIHDVIMCQAGEAKGWGHWVEQSFITDAVRSAHKMKSGVPCDFGHRYESLGWRLGKFKNIRQEGNKMIGDLHIAEYSDKSPQASGLGEYTMAVADEDPTAIMSSIKYIQKYYYQKDASGKEIKVLYWDKKYGWISPIKEYGKIYSKMGELKGCDMVGKGALTQKLYKEEDTQKKGVLTMIKKMFTKNQEMTEEMSRGVSLTELNEKFDRLFAELETIKNSAPEVSDADPVASASEDQNQITALEAKITELEQKLSELSETPAAEPTEVEGDPEGEDEPEKKYSASDIGVHSYIRKLQKS